MPMLQSFRGDIFIDNSKSSIMRTWIKVGKMSLGKNLVWLQFCWIFMLQRRIEWFFQWIYSPFDLDGREDENSELFSSTKEVSFFMSFANSETLTFTFWVENTLNFSQNFVLSRLLSRCTKGHFLIGQTRSRFVYFHSFCNGKTIIAQI